MFAALILSIVTGDSKILDGVRVAETTTSWPSVLAGAIEIFTNEAFDTGTSFNSYPIDEITNVRGAALSEVNLKLPLHKIRL